MQKYGNLVERNKKVHSVDEEIAGRENDMTKDHDGAFVFKLDGWKQLDRFLILGSDKPTYYASAKKMTRDNARNIEELIKKDGIGVVDRIVEISDTGRAPNNDPAIFAMALVVGIGDEKSRKYALDNLSKVVRIGTHLFHFVDYVQEFRGWGRGLRNGISKWYTSKEVKNLAFQVVKYQYRDGWSHRDVLRKAHARAVSDEMNKVFGWVTHGVGGSILDKNGKVVNTFPYTIDDVKDIPIIYGFELAKKSESEDEIVKLIEEYGLPREAVPTQFMGKRVYETLLPSMPLTALIRNLGNLSKVGILDDGNFDEINMVVDKITNQEVLKKARIHPIQLLLALTTYQSGKGFRGNSTWFVNRKVVDALNEAFYLSFGNVESTGKRIMLALDISGSMGWAHVQNTNLSAREASAAMAMVTARTEKDYLVYGFTDTFSKINISPKMSLKEIVKATNILPMNWTDISLPFHWAIDNKVDLDAIVVYTDSETNAGQHPAQVLNKYRQKVGHDVKLIVVGMTATDFTVADPNDKSSLDVVGFDANAPAVMSDFIAGKF